MFNIRTALVLTVLAVALQACHGATFLSAAQTAEIKAQVAPTVNKCQTEFGVTSSYLKEFNDKNKIPDDYDQCFFACILKGVGLLNASGEFDSSLAEKNANKYHTGENLANMLNAIGLCELVNYRSDDEKGCNRARLLFDCFRKGIEDVGVVF